MKLYNTLSRKIEDLKPLQDKKVGIYSCGLTVYSHPHIGNWVGYIYWDVLVRTLEEAGYSVQRVQNITDVGHLVSDDDTGEDKMEKGARQEGLTAWDVASKYTSIANHEGYDLLKLKKPQHMPRATEYIKEQIHFVKELETAGFTYVIADEGVYFDTSKLSDYGKLAQLNVSGLKPGARVDFEGKRNVTDFALWKFSPKNSKRDMEWDSPWGLGFPGWHIECSAMARKLLGDQIDIHTGGVDHIPVHHTNEIAQTEAITKKPFAQIWLHNNHLKIDGGKMAKSLGNIYTLQDIIKKGHTLDAFKLMVLSKHYRTEGNFTWDILRSAENRLANLYAVADLQFQTSSKAKILSADIMSDTKTEIINALVNDLNTPQALSIVNRLFETIENNPGGIHPDSLKPFRLLLASMDALLGLELSERVNISSEQKLLIELRQKARTGKDWKESDRIRDDLASQGIDVKDTEFGPIWSRVKNSP
jgi:cysteinyl-tRNA synthetase